jgi:hypothetical protein
MTPLVHKSTDKKTWTPADTRTLRERARLLRSCGAAWHHLRALGLDSVLVRGELQRIVREERV